jgi:Zn-dependent metalloprotease
MSCHCNIIPKDVLDRLAKDAQLSDQQRQALADTADVDTELRKLRTQAGRLTSVTLSLGVAPVTIPAAPAITVADCHHGQTLPGTPVANPGNAADIPTKNAFDETSAVAKFYKTVFGRNSVDDKGMTLGSSVHYGKSYNNAFWNGSRMVYGDGDGNLFLDFTKSNDVIGHELTHGVTQFSLQLAYTNEAGGLNESMSDCFGSMFRQWRNKQDVNAADWLIGADIMGPGAKTRGYTCLRDMAVPDGKHCLAPQPTHYRQYKSGMDPHYSSGIPNLAFCTIAKALGGNSWDVVGKIWYQAMTGFKPSPAMKMKTFANRTRKLAKTMFPGKAGVAVAVDAGWKSVGL